MAPLAPPVPSFARAFSDSWIDLGVQEALMEVTGAVERISPDARHKTSKDLVLGSDLAKWLGDLKILSGQASKLAFRPVLTTFS
jgi:hypothetical protein